MIIILGIGLSIASGMTKQAIPTNVDNMATFIALAHLLLHGSTLASYYPSQCVLGQCVPLDWSHALVYNAHTLLYDIIYLIAFIITVTKKGIRLIGCLNPNYRLRYFTINNSVQVDTIGSLPWVKYVELLSTTLC